MLRRLLPIVLLVCLSACKDGPEVRVNISTPNPSEKWQSYQGNCYLQKNCPTGEVLVGNACVVADANNACVGGGMNYSDSRTGASGFVPYSQTDKMICFSSSDLQTLIDYCGSKK